MSPSLVSPGAASAFRSRRCNNTVLPLLFHSYRLRVVADNYTRGPQPWSKYVSNSEETRKDS